MENDEPESEETLEQSIMRVLGPRIRELIAEKFTEITEELVQETLDEMESILNDGVCTFDFHVSECEIDAHDNCRECGKPISEHRTVYVCDHE